MRVAVAADHAGFPLYELAIGEVRKLGHEALGLNRAGPPDPGDDYTDFAVMVGEKVQRGECERGIVICGSGVGVSVAASKLVGVRACMCHDTYSAHQGVEHDAMNVLCLGAKIIGDALMLELVRAFLGASFDGAARHQRRLDKIAKIEASPRG